MAHPYGSVDAGPSLYVGYNPYHPLWSESYFKFDPKVTLDQGGNLYMTWLGGCFKSMKKDVKQHIVNESEGIDEVSAQSMGMMPACQK